VRGWNVRRLVVIGAVRVPYVSQRHGEIKPNSTDVIPTVARAYHSSGGNSGQNWYETVP
jgi:hypothetical protein